MDANNLTRAFITAADAVITIGQGLGIMNEDTPEIPGRDGPSLF